MKNSILISLAIAVSAQLDIPASESDVELLKRVRSHMETGGGGVMGDLNEEIGAATAEQRKRLLTVIRQIIEEELRDATPPEHRGDIGVIGRCASVLERAGDEEAVLTVFGSRLTQVGFGAEQVVIPALARSRDSKAVEAIADFAQLRQKQLIELLPQIAPPATRTNELEARYENISRGWFFALLGLASSPNPSGKPLARELRDGFLKLLDGKPYQEAFLQLYAAELDPLLRGASQPALPHNGAAVATPTAKSKQLQQSKLEKPGTVAPSEQKQSSSSRTILIAGVLAALVLLGALIWFLRKK